MLSLNAAPPRPRRASALLAAVLYLGLAIAAPLAHARSEVLSSRPEVEVQHSQLCARIHTEATCLVGIAFQVLAPAPRALPTAGPERTVPARAPRQTSPLRPEATSRHLVRAPPTR